MIRSDELQQVLKPCPLALQGGRMKTISTVPLHEHQELRARHAALVEAASRGLSLLYELGSPHCNTELALKDIAMVSEELKAALAKEVDN